MKQQYSIDEIRRLEQHARRLHSDAIFDSFFNLLKGIGWTISRLFASLRKTEGHAGSCALEARAS